MEERIGQNDGIEQLVFSLYQELRNIQGNINYVNKELPTLAVSQELRDRVAKVFDRLEVRVALTKKEVESLEGALRNSSNAPECAVLERLRKALDKETREISGLVFMVQSASNSPDGLGLLNFLLTESAANILNALTRFRQSIDGLEKVAAKPAD
jgi:hypothetical protein